MAFGACGLRSLEWASMNMRAELEILRTWFEFNMEARRSYLEAYGKIPAEELSQDRGASYSSILGIHEHILGGIFFWIKNGFPALIRRPPPDTGVLPTLNGVRQLEQYIDALVRDFLNGLTESELGRTLPVPKRAGYAAEIEVQVRDMMWHMVEEEVQHRGELNALLWQIDVDPPILDWIAWAYIPEKKPGG
jgi:uncharacterized damage-inducible protein DinB